MVLCFVIVPLHMCLNEALDFTAGHRLLNIASLLRNLSSKQRLIDQWAGEMMDIVQKEMKLLAEEYSTTCVPPHVTLMGGIGDTEEGIMERAVLLSSLLKVCDLAISSGLWSLDPKVFGLRDLLSRQISSVGKVRMLPHIWMVVTGLRSQTPEGQPLKLCAYSYKFFHDPAILHAAVLQWYNFVEVRINSTSELMRKYS